MNIHINKTIFSETMSILREFIKVDVSFDKEESTKKDEYLLKIVLKLIKHKH